MSRILRHISSKDLKRTHQKKLSEQKELAAKKLKECQEAEAERKQIEEIARPYKSSWREEIQLQESEWFSIPGSGPTNSASQSFQYGWEGGPIATFSGLGGVEAYPSTVDVDGETYNTPNYSQLGLQGYAPPLGGVQRQTQQIENERIDAEIRKLEEQIKQLDQKRSDLENEQLETEPQYTGMTPEEYADRDNEIGEKWADTMWPLQKKLNDNPECIAADKCTGTKAALFRMSEQMIQELEDLYNEYMSQTEAHAKALDAHFDTYNAKIDSVNQKIDALKAKIAELEKQRPINQQLDASQQAYPNLPFMGARVGNMGMINPSVYADAMKSVVNALSGLTDRIKSNVAALRYRQEIAQSILSNKPIDIPQSEIPKSHIKGLIDGIENDPSVISQLMTTYTNTPTQYSDDNIYELPNGEVRTHTPETRKLYPKNMVYVGSDDDGSNPIAGAGEAQMELVDPKDGQPYVKYRDHAYVNLKSKDPDEIPDSFSKFASDAVHLVRDIMHTPSLDHDALQTPSDAPNTGAMKHHPSNVRGDVSKTVIIPYSEMGPKLRRAVNDRIGVEQQRAAGINVGSPEVNTGTGRDGTFGRGTYGQGRPSDLASQASSAVGIRRKKKEKLGESTWSRLKKYR